MSLTLASAQPNKALHPTALHPLRYGKSVADLALGHG